MSIIKVPLGDVIGLLGAMAAHTKPFELKEMVETIQQLRHLADQLEADPSSIHTVVLMTAGSFLGSEKPGITGHVVGTSPGVAGAYLALKNHGEEAFDECLSDLLELLDITPDPTQPQSFEIVH